MSGGVVQLVATGPQDEWLTGKPEVSFYRSNYRRSTHYANSIERQIIQGDPAPGNISTVRFEKKGDLLSYVYLSAVDSSGNLLTPAWNTIIDKIDLYIGGQMIDTQDFTYSAKIEPVTGSQTVSQRNRSLTDVTASYQSYIYPLKFFFCKDWSVAIPLVALQFHDVEIRITWSQSLNLAVGTQMQSWVNYVYLDQAERDWFATTKQDMLITQVQRTTQMAARVQEVALAQPIKFLAIVAPAYTGDSTQKFYTLINGTEVGDLRPLPHWTDAAPYYHTPVGWTSTLPVAIISYCLDTSKLQPTGTLNFSRLDSFRIVVPSTTTVAGMFGGGYIYAVNYNVLRIQNGLGSLLYAS